MLRSLVSAAVLAAFVLLSPTSARATLVDQGGATLDTLTNLLWLDASASEGLSALYVSLSLAQLQPLFDDGWRLATTAEVCQLMASYAGDTTGEVCPVVAGLTPSPAELNDTTVFDQIFGHITPVSNVTTVYSIFDDGDLVSDTGGLVFTFGTIAGLTGPGARYGVIEQSRTKLGKFLGFATHNNALLVQEVPEPSAVALLACAGAALIGARRSRAG